MQLNDSIDYLKLFMDNNYRISLLHEEKIFVYKQTQKSFTLI